MGKEVSPDDLDLHASYCGSQYSRSTCVSFRPVVGLAEVDVRAIPLILASFPVPPVMGPTVVAVRLLASGLCTATREPRVKNLSPFSSTNSPKVVPSPLLLV